jgi:hypothetical protein
MKNRLRSRTNRGLSRQSCAAVDLSRLRSGGWLPRTWSGSTDARACFIAVRSWPKPTTCTAGVRGEATASTRHRVNYCRPGTYVMPGAAFMSSYLFDATAARFRSISGVHAACASGFALSSRPREFAPLNASRLS